MPNSEYTDFSEKKNTNENSRSTTPYGSLKTCSYTL